MSSASPHILFGGIDGGATKSTAIIIDDEGKILSTIEGPSTQLWLIGLEESARRIRSMFQKCFVIADLPTSTQLQAIGCCISGSEQDQRNLEFAKSLKELCSDLSKLFIIRNDTFAPVFSVSPTGGIVLISGTGSNCQYISKDVNIRCGGWGHALGEEGSAFWIAFQAIKMVFDHEDNYRVTNNIDLVKTKLYEYFNIANQYEMLDHFYVNFQKPFVAGFCKTLSTLARNNDDDVSKRLFADAGKSMAMHIIALLTKLDKVTNDQEIKVVCVGSVFKSWDLLKPGFENEMAAHHFTNIQHVHLLELEKPNALGSALLAATSLGYCARFNYRENYKVFHTYSW